MTHAVLVLSAAAVAVALFALGYAVASAPPGDPPRLGLRGLKRARGLERYPVWAGFEPAVRWVARRLRGLVSERQLAALDDRLARGGDALGIAPAELLALSVLSGVAGSVFGVCLMRVVHGGQLVVVMCTVVGIAAPFVRLQGLTTDRQTAISRRLPSAIDLLALAMGAGLDFPSAVRQIVDKSADGSDPLVEELMLVLQALVVGRTRQQALAEFAHRVPVRAVLDFTGAVIQAELRGTPVANVLALQAEANRLQRSVTAEEAAAKAGIRLVIPLGLVFVCVLLVIVAPTVIRLKMP